MKPVTKYHITKDETICPEEDIERYIDVLNGIAYRCSIGGYKQGYRNDIAVNLTVSSYMLGLSPLQVLKSFEEAGIILDEMDDESPLKRVETVLGYSDRFDWDYMLDPEYYESAGHMADGNSLVLVVLDD